MKRRDFFSNAAKVSAGFSLMSFMSCSGPTGPDEEENNSNNNNGGNYTPPPTNKSPVTNAIKRNFSDDGEVRYYFSGSDSDGYVKYIRVSFNGGDFMSLGSGSDRSVSIIKGTNSVLATAYDDKGKAGNAVRDSFISLEESAAEKIIEAWLSANKTKYKSFEKNRLISIGASGSFYTDFLVTLNSGRDAHIDYVGYTKNLEEELANRNELNSYGISNLYLVRVPEDEIKSQIDKFIK